MPLHIAEMGCATYQR